MLINPLTDRPQDIDRNNAAYTIQLSILQLSPLISLYASLALLVYVDLRRIWGWRDHNSRSSSQYSTLDIYLCRYPREFDHGPSTHL